MGGRGGSPNATTQAPSRPAAPVSLAIDPEREFRQWLDNPRDIAADTLNPELRAHDRDEKVYLLLPDRDAILQFDGESFVVRDNQTDERLPFKAQRHTTVYRQIARYYGRRIEYLDREGKIRHFGKNVENLRDTPAARKHRIR